MNNQNETTQLRYLEETAIRLRQNGFTVEPIKDQHLPVRWEATTSAGSPDGAACCTDRRTWMASAHRMLCRSSSISLP